MVTAVFAIIAVMLCPLCHLTKNIVDSDHNWTVVVNDDQGYLGRCYVALKRHETDLTALTREERDSLWVWFGRIKAALETLFEPDHYNYVFLMNVQPHLHGHIIPRYAKNRTLRGMTFVDGRLGAHYDLDNVQLLPDSLLEDLAAEIHAALPQILSEQSI